MRKIPDVLTIEEQSQLINIFDKRYFYPIRNRTMIELFLCTGLRVSEMANLKWRDINLMSGQLKVVQGKGSKDRIIWIDEEMLTKLQIWKEKQFKRFGKCEIAFCTSSKIPIMTKDITFMVKKYSKKAGISKNVSSHTLRHTFATDLLRATKNIRLVQKALGHSDLSTTMIYTHIVDDEFEDAMKSYRSMLK
ncbi:MAG: tyrosine-type recombinase/integrase [Sarcina sp.]